MYKKNNCVTLHFITSLGTHRVLYTLLSMQIKETISQRKNVGQLKVHFNIELHISIK